MLFYAVILKTKKHSNNKQKTFVTNQIMEILTVTVMYLSSQILLEKM